MAKKIRILHCIRQGTFGGGESYLYNLATGLDPQTYDSLVLSFTDGAMIQRMRTNGYKTLVTKSPLPFGWGNYRRILRFIRREKIDLIHAHGTKAAMNILPIAKILGIPAVYTVHGWSFHPGKTGLSDTIRVAAESLVSRMAKITVCVSEANLQEGLDRVGVRNYRVIRNGIHTGEFDPLRTTPLKKEYFGFEQHNFIIASIARLTFQKDPLTLIRAFAKVVKEVPEARLLFVGDGEMREPCLQLVKDLLLEKQVVFAPFTSYVAQALSEVDVFVLPSLWEGLSLSLMEAMCMRKPVIATSITANRELVSHGYNGMLFPVADDDQLANYLVKIATDERFRELLSNNARDTILRSYDFSRVVRENHVLYQELMKTDLALKPETNQA